MNRAHRGDQVEVFLNTGSTLKGYLVHAPTNPGDLLVVQGESWVYYIRDFQYFTLRSDT